MKYLSSKAVAKMLAGVSMLAAGTILSAPAYAQTAPAAKSDTGLSDIIVTARKVEERLQNVPVSVTAFSGQQLKDQGAARLEDVAAFTPALLIIGSAADTDAPLFSSRGQAQTDVLATLEPSVGVYVDGLYMARAHGLNADLLDISSVQTLKGPQGTLFGHNTSAGAVLLETNKPKLDAVSADVIGTYGRFNQVGLSGIINLPIIKDTLGFRGGIQIRKRDGIYTDTVSGKKYNDIDNLSGRAKLLWKPAPNVSVIAAGDWYSYQSNGPVEFLRYIAPTPTAASAAQAIQSGNPGVPAAIGATFSCIVGNPPPVGTVVGCGVPGLAGNVGLIGSAAIAGLGAFGVTTNPLTGTGAPPTGLGLLGTSALQNIVNLANSSPNTIALNGDPFTKAKTQTYTLTATVDEPYGTYKVIGGYRNTTSLARVDLDGTPYTLLHTTGTQALHQWSIEGQLAGKILDKKLNYVIGATYFSEGGSDESTSQNALGIGPALSGGRSADTQPHFYGRIDNSSYGIYGQGTYHFDDRFSFTAGLRYSSDSKKLETHSDTYVLNTTTSIPGICALPAPGVFVGTTTPSPGTTYATNDCQYNTSAKFTALSYTAGLEYKITPDVLIYAKTSRGYRSGGLNLRENTGGLALQSTTIPGTLATTEPFAKEVNDEQEIGLKSEFFNRKLRINIAGFYNKVKNKQISILQGVPGSNTLLTILSNGDQRDYGAEATVAVRVTPDLTLEASGSLLDAKLTKFLQPSFLGSTVLNDTSSDFVTYAPKSQYSVAANYAHDFGGMKLRGRIDYSWTAAYYYAPTSCATYKTTPGCATPLAAGVIDSETAPAAGILGGRIGMTFDHDKYGLEVWGRNLTNNRAYQSGLYIPSFGLSALATRREPSSYGVTINAKF